MDEKGFSISIERHCRHSLAASERIISQTLYKSRSLLPWATVHCG